MLLLLVARPRRPHCRTHAAHFNRSLPSHSPQLCLPPIATLAVALAAPTYRVPGQVPYGRSASSAKPGHIPPIPVSVPPCKSIGIIEPNELCHVYCALCKARKSHKYIFLQQLRECRRRNEGSHNLAGHLRDTVGIPEWKRNTRDREGLSRPGVKGGGTWRIGSEFISLSILCVYLLRSNSLPSLRF